MPPPTTTRIALIGNHEVDHDAQGVSSDSAIFNHHSLGSSLLLGTGRGHREEEGTQMASMSTHVHGESDTRQTALSREAARCREKRQRRKERERLLREEVELLTLYKAIVDGGPDLFSLHRVDLEAPFSFACDEFYERLRLEPEDVLGRPLASIVDPRDAHTLRTAVFHVLSLQNARLGDGSAQEAGGKLVQLRVACGGLSCHANMSMSIGSQGLIVVTRLYGV